VCVAGQQPGVSAQVCEAADVPDSRGWAPLCPQCLSHGPRGRSEGKEAPFILLVFFPSTRLFLLDFLCIQTKGRKPTFVVDFLTILQLSSLMLACCIPQWGLGVTESSLTPLAFVSVLSVDAMHPAAARSQVRGCEQSCTYPPLPGLIERC